MSLTASIWFFATLTIALATIVLARLRRIAMPALGQFWLILGALMLALAAGGFTINWPHRPEIVVMIDRSASTRGASFRDANNLKTRIDQLLGQTPHRQIDFSDGSADQTIFDPPHADAIVLFSDAQFDPPATAPPTYIIVDPNLEHPDDAAITALEFDGNIASTTIRTTSQPRQLRVNDADAGTIASGQHIISTSLGSHADIATAKLSPADAWPENDTLTVHAPPPAQLERWWIGDAPPSGWRLILPADLPSDASAYLAASIIAVQNIPAEAIPPAQQARLIQYVRDFGGGLLILGGDHAFGAGYYLGSSIEALSPLASSAPIPQRYWIILVDSSGSMAGPVEGGQTRWQRAAEAVKQLLPHLPPNDLISIGSFARDLRWWSQSRSTSATAKLALPPPDISPVGPTNLEPVLQSIAGQLQPGRTDVIVVSDADVKIDDPQGLAGAFRDKGARLHLLATADASRSPLLQLAVLTAGRVVAQPDPKLWEDAAVQLLQSAAPGRVELAPANVAFAADLSALPPRSLDQWNRTWLKTGATELASATVDNQHIPLVARWNLGDGRVAAAAFPADPTETEAMAALVASPPRDPRFKVSFASTSPLRITIDAAENDRHLNDLDLSLLVGTAPQPSSLKFTQSAPGRYEISLPAPRLPTSATIRLADRNIDRFELPGRYPHEFDHIGNNHDVMRQLAQLSGGAVIEPSQSSPIDFHFPREPVSLASLLATSGAACIALALLVWKRS